MRMRFHQRLGLVGALGLAMVTLGTWTKADEVPLDQVPASIRSAIERKYPKAEIQRVETEQKSGRPIYDIDLLLNDLDLDLMMTPEGTILQSSLELDPEKLPQAIADAVKAHKFGTIRWAELTTRGPHRRYQLIVGASDEQLRGVELDPEGKVLDSYSY